MSLALNKNCRGGKCNYIADATPPLRHSFPAVNWPEQGNQTALPFPPKLCESSSQAAMIGAIALVLMLAQGVTPFCLSPE